MRGGSGRRARARPGDGLYQCRLYQRGAQKIFGFEFGADVTMDMSERIENGNLAIDFKCVDSQFFSKFDGAWTLEALDDNRTIVRYVVDVRPKGPVPVAALEWRIREDVPTNVLAVKDAAVAVGAQVAEERRRDAAAEGVSIVGALDGATSQPRRAPSMGLGADWYVDETMATYL